MGSRLIGCQCKHLFVTNVEIYGIPMQLFKGYKCNRLSITSATIYGY